MKKETAEEWARDEYSRYCRFAELRGGKILTFEEWMKESMAGKLFTEWIANAQER
jgi:hypothetical protein